ncbi:MAG: porin [Proteobacteria bacterium]|nr:porin [Pseudomonadota bacterium]
MKKSLLLATSAFVAFGAAAANAVDVDLYGQANKSILVYDDGKDTQTNFVDNDKSSTRFGLRGSQALDNGLTASVLIEAEVQSGGNGDSNTIAQNNSTTLGTTPQPANAAGLTERHTRVGLAGNWGAVFLGRTSTATDGITEIDIAGVDDVLGSGVDRFGGGLSFRQNNTAGTAVATVSQAFDNLDGIASRSHNDRVQTVRYDSPIFNGFQGRIAAAQGGDIDAAVLYSGKIDAFEVKGGVGYVAFNNTATAANNILEDQWAGSLSVKHDMGIGATIAYGEQNLDKKATGVDDPNFIYVKLGYTWDAFEVGADYTKASDMQIGTLNQEATAWGLAGQYNMGNGVSLAGLYRNMDLDRTGTNTDSINLYALNLRVKF